MALQAVPPPTKVSPETASKAVDALLKWIKSKAKNQKAQLLEHDEFVYLILTIKKIPPKGRTNPYKIPLPNPLHPFDSSEELCLIFDDRSKSSLTSESAKKKIQSENIPISKVLKLSKLKSDYRPFEAKRKLCSSYDLFFADKRIIPLLPRHLGKEFFKKKKIPIPVDLTKKNWKEQIQLACQSALLFLRTGTCSVIKVGRVSQSREEIVANVIAAIDGVAEIVPKKWENIRSFHLKLTDSLALPLYQTVPDVGLKIEGVKKQEEGKKVDSQTQAESGEESVGEGKEKKSGKSKKKRGRIHEVRYMDNGEIMDDLFSDKGNDDESNADVALDNAELTGKKRKKAKGLVLDEELQKGKAVSKKNKKKNVLQSEGKGAEQVDNEELVGDIKKATKSKQKAATGKKKTTQSEGKEEEQVNNEELVGDVKKATKSEQKAATGKKKITQSEGKEEEQVNNEELVGDVKKATKSQKAATGKKKKIAVSALGNGREIDDDKAVDGDKSVSSDIKKKKTKVSGGIKLKSKKTRK